MKHLHALCANLNTILITKLCILLLAVNRIEAEFKLEPGDTSAVEGEQGMFACVPKSITSTQTVAWKQGDTIISSDDISKDPNHFQIVVDRNINQYTLIIEKAIRSFDKSTFQCCVMENDSEEYCSKEAILTVDEIPGKQFPECSPKTEIYRSPESVTLSCISELTEPKVKLEWWEGSKRISSRPAEERGGQLVAQYNFEAKPEHDGRFFRCSMFSKKLSIQRNCTIGPLNVQFRPKVSIQAPIDIHAGREAVFICSGVSKPRATSYEWKLERPSLEGEYRTESSGFVLRIFNPEKFNRTLIRCTVSNSEGTGQDEIMINVQKKSETYFSSRNLTRKVVSPDALHQSSNPDEMTIAMILAITGSCSFIIVLLMLIPLCMVRLFSHKVTMDASGRIIAQPDVYFEPKDTILTNEPTLCDTVTWRRNVGIQVPVDLESGSESMYAEVETEVYTKNLSNGSIYVAKSTHV